MCGIAGIASAAARDDAYPRLQRMMDLIAHRGPDDEGIYLSGDREVVLGHRRLSIVDLSAAGRQPMTVGTTGLWLTFNGEIYNFRDIRRELEQLGDVFRTHSDSEVIIHAYRRWGPACLSRFNGMFALALYDEGASTVFLARDRVGKKPLFWSHRGAEFCFASNAKAVAIASGSLDLDAGAVERYFAFGYIPGSQSIFANVNRIPPGHWLKFDIGKNQVHSERYWSPEALVASDQNLSDAVLLEELEALLEDSVQLRLMADVPVGVLLSGGVDSSIITALASRRASGPVRTFTVAFPGGGRYDESGHARAIASHFGTEHHELPLPQADIDVLGPLVRRLDEPLADPSVVPTYMVSQLTRQHVTVALGGDGGDELFGGYVWYRDALVAERRSSFAPALLRRIAARAASALPPGVRGRNFVQAHAAGFAEFMTARALMFDEKNRAKLLRVRVTPNPELERREMWDGDEDPVRAMSLLDLHSYLPDDILIKVDRASMAFALEMRAPFLDHRLVEFAIQRVPSQQKVTRDGARFLQRALARKLLPPHIDLDRKQGFVMPVHEWFRGKWGDATLEKMQSPAVQAWIDPAYVRRLLDGHRRGRTNGIRLFSLLMFAAWLEDLG